jgi:histidyl-tRNA synthetase
VDVIGSDSLLNEYELVRIIDDIFSRLRVSIVVKINNRKILSGIAGYIGEDSRITDITVAIDKLDKIGIDAVNAELTQKGVSIEAVNKLQPLLLLKGSADEKLSRLEELLSHFPAGLKGIEEMRTLFSYVVRSEMSGKVELDLTLARGLNYYTGAIIEVKSADVSIGSICGGGRYDNLAGIFGMEGVSGVGVSFGADRIYDVLKQLDLFGNTGVTSSQVLMLNFGENETSYALSIVDILRKLSVRAELYPDAVKLKKQMSYADSKKIPFIIIAGADEIGNNSVTIKNMTTGVQEKVSREDLQSYAEKNFVKQNGI